LSELEAALAALVPRMEGINRDRLMFLAGQASVEPVGQIANLPEVRQIKNLSHFWPAAFAAMTAIAASLLVALIIRPAPQATGQGAEQKVAVSAQVQEPASAVADGRAESGSMVDSPAMAAALPDWWTWVLFPQPTVNMKYEPSYTELRNQTLLHGGESWRLQAILSAAPGRIQDEPVLDREQLNRWLKQEGVEGALRRLSTPTLRNPSGAKS